MRIAFDGTTLMPGRTGVGYYTEHLLHHLAQQSGGDTELVVVSNRAVDTVVPLPPRVRVSTASVQLPRMVWMQALAPRTLGRLRVDVAHFTNGMVPLASPVPTVVTIHDMSLTLYPCYHPLRRVLLNRPLVDMAARRANAVITVSQSAKRDIVRLYNLPADRVHVVHEAAAPAFVPVRDQRELDRVRRKYGLADRVILYVGTIEPRKNLTKLIEAFAERHRSGDLAHQLVCVGPYGWLSRDLESQLERLKIADAIRFTGYVPFGDLPVLYSLSEMFVFPSLYEGFGLPVIEAMACGTPVVAGRHSAFGEIADAAIEYPEALEPDALGDVMVALASNRERREELSRLGVERARLFSWERAALETFDIYRRAAGVVEAVPSPRAVAAPWLP